MELTRRDFLKLVTALSVSGFWLARPRRAARAAAPYQGRIIPNYTFAYKQPNFQSKPTKILWQDTVVSISEATVGAEPAYNRVWYRIDGAGYVHSGVVQPVHTELQPPQSDIPRGGQLAEVTVPYTDAYWGPGKQYEVAYRFYYATTHWVIAFHLDEQSQPWYEVFDDKWEYTYFVRATHLRLIAPSELQPLSPDVPNAQKRLVVHTPLQLVIAYEGEKPVFMARCATGAIFSNGDFRTPPGQYMTFHKMPSRHMAAGNLAANGYDLPGVPWVSYITEEGISFHGTFWHNDYGKPRSHGCINMTPQAARWVYLWTHPVVPPNVQRLYEDYGTKVEVI